MTLLSRASRAGRQIGQLVPLSNDELKKLIEGDERQSRERVGLSPDQPAIESYLSSALIAVEEFDGHRLEQTLRSAVLRMPGDEVLDQVIGPLLFTIGSLWHQGLLRPANEHLATTTIRRVLVWMSDLAVPDAGAPIVVVGTPAHQMHELGAMLAATTAASCGWRVAYLGPNLPADELARAVRHARARLQRGRAFGLLARARDDEERRAARVPRRAVDARSFVLIGRNRHAPGQQDQGPER